MNAPAIRTPVAMTNGAIHIPLWARYPNTIGEMAPNPVPTMFIIAETEPLYSLPMSMATAHAGPRIMLRENNDPDMHQTTTPGVAINAEGTRKAADPSMALTHTIRRAFLRSPVRLYSQSETAPPVTPPTAPAISGNEASHPMLLMETWWCSTR